MNVGTRFYLKTFAFKRRSFSTLVNLDSLLNCYNLWEITSDMISPWHLLYVILTLILKLTIYIYIQLFICTCLMVCGFIVYVYFQVEISYATDLFNTHSEKLFFATRWNVNYYRYCFLVSWTYFRINVFRHIYILV